MEAARRELTLAVRPGGQFGKWRRPRQKEPAQRGQAKGPKPECSAVTSAEKCEIPTRTVDTPSALSQSSLLRRDGGSPLGLGHRVQPGRTLDALGRELCARGWVEQRFIQLALRLGPSLRQLRDPF